MKYEYESSGFFVKYFALALVGLLLLPQSIVYGRRILASLSSTFFF